MNATAARPTVAALRARPPVTPKLLAPLDSATLRRLCLECGADDVGFVELDRPALSLANTEFHHATDQVNAVGHALVRALEGRGLRSLNVTAGFPMEMDRFPGRIWVLSHKTAAEAAGLGRMGIHRNVIHPRFGSFILLGSVLLEAEVDRHARLLDYNPCLVIAWLFVRLVRMWPGPSSRANPSSLGK